MRKLVVNADDLGADEARSAGIFEAIEAGVVTSASLLANGDATDGAIRRIRTLGDRPVSIGAHINLSEGRPLSPGLEKLVGQDGLFLGKAKTHQILIPSGDPQLDREIEQEMTFQIASLHERGIRLDHLDGHQHVHVFPAAFLAAVKLALRFRIPWIRIPDEPYPLQEKDHIPEDLAKEARSFSKMAESARSRLKGSPIRAADRFRGLSLKGRLSVPVLLDLLRGLQPGLTELMVHPGRVPNSIFSGPFSGFSTPDREKELEALLDRRFREALRNSEIALTPFPGMGAISSV